MNNMDMTFGKKKNSSRRPSKEAEASALQRPHGSRKSRNAMRTQQFFRLMSVGLSSPHTPVLRRHD
jgi:hypothetical protein